MFVPLPPFLDQDEGRRKPLKADSRPSLTAHFASIQQPQGAWRRPCPALAAEGDSGMDAQGLSSGGSASCAPAFPGYEHLFAITSHYLLCTMLPRVIPTPETSFTCGQPSWSPGRAFGKTEIKT